MKSRLRGILSVLVMPTEESKFRRSLGSCAEQIILENNHFFNNRYLKESKIKVLF